MTHDFQGDKYRQASTHQQEWGKTLIESLALRGDERILDMGCGDGRLTAMLADHVPHGHVIGIDASPGMLAEAQQLERPNLTFLLLDINNITFRDEFNVIFSNAALHWVHDHDRLLTNVYQALMKGGIARFNFAGEGNCGSLIRVIREVMVLPQFRPAFIDLQWPWYMPSVEAYRQLAMGLSFIRLEVWEENADRFFPDADAMIRWIDQPSLVPFLSGMLEHVRQVFRDMVVERMVTATRQPDGRCFETFRRINFIGYKGV